MQIRSQMHYYHHHHHHHTIMIIQYVCIFVLYLISVFMLLYWLLCYLTFRPEGFFFEFGSLLS